MECNKKVILDECLIVRCNNVKGHSEREHSNLTISDEAGLIGTQTMFSDVGDKATMWTWDMSDSRNVTLMTELSISRRLY